MSVVLDASLWVLGPSIVLVALVGLGELFLPRDAQLPVQRPVAAALIGLVVLAAAIPLWNLAFPVGLHAGAFTVALGVGLALVTRGRNELSGRGLLSLVGAVVTVAALYRASSLVIPIRFLTDTVVYHLPHAEWLAREPIPLGAGNLQTRLGFNPGFMTVVAAFRFAALGQTHLFVTEVAIRALFVLTTIDVLRLAIGRGSEWLRAFALAIGAVSLPFFAINKSGTDGNVGFLLLIIVLIAVAVHGPSSNERQADGPSFLLALIALAATFKLSSAMAVLLLVPLLTGPRRVLVRALWSSRALPLLALTILASAGWVLRSLAATGCLVFPVAVTCTPVRWGVGTTAADITATHVTAFARRTSWASGEVALLDLGWITGWVPTYLTSVPALVVLAAVPVAVIGRARTSRRSIERTAGPLLWLTAMLAAAPALLVALSVADLLGGRRFLGVDPAVVGVLSDYPYARLLLLLPVVGLALLLVAAASMPTRSGDWAATVEQEERSRVRILVPFLVASLAYWFISAPAVRFAWAPHAVVAALLLTRWIASLDTERLLRILPRRLPALSATAAVLAILAVAALQPALPITEPTAREIDAFTLDPAGITVRVPQTVDECSTMFPCAPVPVGGLSATRAGGRLVIVDGSDDASRLLEELGIIERR